MVRREHQRRHGTAPGYRRGHRLPLPPRVRRGVRRWLQPRHRLDQEARGGERLCHGRGHGGVRDQLLQRQLGRHPAGRRRPALRSGELRGQRAGQAHLGEHGGDRPVLGEGVRARVAPRARRQSALLAEGDHRRQGVPHAVRGRVRHADDQGRDHRGRGAADGHGRRLPASDAAARAGAGEGLPGSAVTQVRERGSPTSSPSIPARRRSTTATCGGR